MYGPFTVFPASVRIFFGATGRVLGFIWFQFLVGLVQIKRESYG